MGDREKTIVVLVAVAVFFGGHVLGSRQQGSPTEQVAALPQHGAHHRYGTLDISTDDSVPQVDLVVHKDPMSGLNLEIITENFRFAPEHASTEHVPGEGHAHLYLDGKKIARVYGRWFHIEDPAPSAYSIRVTLDSNSHKELVVNGKVVEDVEPLTITGQ